MRIALLASALGGALALGACQGYDNTTRQAGEGALAGAAVGAAAGAISGDVGVAEGAAIGAAGGAAYGAYQGCQEDNRCPWNDNSDVHSDLMYDSNANRYYYENYRTDCTYWRNGEVRYCS